MGKIPIKDPNFLSKPFLKTFVLTCFVAFLPLFYLNVAWLSVLIDVFYDHLVIEPEVFTIGFYC